MSGLSKVEKLVAVSTIFILMITTLEVLWQIPYICYLIWFQDNIIRVLIDFGRKVNAMILGFVLGLGLSIWKTNVNMQKINDLALKTYTNIFLID